MKSSITIGTVIRVLIVSDLKFQYTIGSQNMLEPKHKFGYYSSYAVSIITIVSLTWAFYLWK